jgi:hypothetical protein
MARSSAAQEGIGFPQSKLRCELSTSDIGNPEAGIDYSAAGIDYSAAGIDYSAEATAIEKPAAEFKVPATKLMAIRG